MKLRIPNSEVLPSVTGSTCSISVLAFVKAGLVWEVQWGTNKSEPVRGEHPAHTAAAQFALTLLYNVRSFFTSSSSTDCYCPIVTACFFLHPHYSSPLCTFILRKMDLQWNLFFMVMKYKYTLRKWAVRRGRLETCWSALLLHQPTSFNTSLKSISQMHILWNIQKLSS